MSKKYEKFDLNIEKLNSHARDEAPRIKKKKAVSWSTPMVGGHSLHIIVYRKRLRFANFVRPIHHKM